VVADNYGDPTTCLAEIQFFGVGEKSVSFFFYRGCGDEKKVQRWL